MTGALIDLVEDKLIARTLTGNALAHIWLFPSNWTSGPFAVQTWFARPIILTHGGHNTLQSGPQPPRRGTEQRCPEDCWGVQSLLHKEALPYVTILQSKMKSCKMQP